MIPVGMMTSAGDRADSGGISFKDKFRHAFAVGEEYEEKLLEDEEQLLDDFAHKINRRGLAVIAIPLLLFHKPLNTIGANFIQMGEYVFTARPVEVFLKRILGDSYSHELLVRTLEKRCSIDRLVELLEALADERSRPYTRSPRLRSLSPSDDRGYCDQ